MRWNLLSIAKIEGGLIIGTMHKGLFGHTLAHCLVESGCIYEGGLRTEEE